MGSTSVSKRVPDHFPTGVAHAGTGAWVAGWTRTYPVGCDVRDGTDHLAVGSGAYRRHAEGPDAFTRGADGRWVEDLSGVRFDDVDADYLAYIRSIEAPRGRVRVVAGWVDAWARTPEGVYAFGPDVYPGRETGWMYKTLGTLAYHRARRDRDDVLSESGFCPADETPDDGWAAGRAWGSEGRDWVPERKDVHRLMERIRGRETPATYERKRAGEYVRGGLVLVHAPDGSKAMELPGRWAPTRAMEEVRPDTYRMTGLEFVDRHAWDAALGAAEDLRTLYTRVVEQGPACVPDGEDEGPVAWVYGRVAEVMARVPTDPSDVRLMRFVREVRKAANACLDAAERMDRPAGDLDLGRLFDLVDAEADTRRRSTGVRVTRRGDVAMCEPVN
jgi:hypothetical protein